MSDCTQKEDTLKKALYGREQPFKSEKGSIFPKMPPVVKSKENLAFMS